MGYTVLQSVLKFFLGSKNDQFIKKMQPKIDAINALEEQLSELDDKSLQDKTAVFKKRLADNQNLDSILIEAFAVVREVSKRTIGLRHHDVQLLGGMALHYGQIAEMATGEGKTLVATLPAYLNALTGKGVHIVTVNSYLAKRDAEWMGKIFQFLSMSVGTILPNMSVEERKEAYNSDITYANNGELGFDFLRDNMANSAEQQVLKPLHFAIVDEVDSILIDEARTPLIISGPIGQSSDMYRNIYPLVNKLTDTGDTPDVSISLKEKQVQLTEKGHDHIEKLLQDHGILAEKSNMYLNENALILHFIDACIRAKFILKKDIDYIIQDGKIVIIDEHTGRAMPGRRWSSGHHQAVEAKEGVAVQEENQTLASITFQNFFRIYEKLGGMTGTADTEAQELEEIYNLEVLVMPTNKPCIRKDSDDTIYMTQAHKFEAIVQDIVTRNKKQQPVLVGTTSIENSEYLSQLLTKNNIAHNVLNAKQHEAEADIIAQAGEPGRVTIATNMAGRGTDIVLGGNLEVQIKRQKQPLGEKTLKTMKSAWLEKQKIVKQAGGLHVLGSERHECRRVDNQLRGRCSRQGDPGSSQFFLSLEDHLFKIFPKGILDFIKKSSSNPKESLQAPMLNHAIASNQKKMEAHYFDIRKQLLKYDDIANEQRLVFYEQRNELLHLDGIHSHIASIFESAMENIAAQHTNDQGILTTVTLERDLEKTFGKKPDLQALQALKQSLPQGLKDFYYTDYDKKTNQLPREQFGAFEKNLLLSCLDHHWKEHLLTMEDLREGIGFRGYAQRNPEHEYKIDAYHLFENMRKKVMIEYVSKLIHLQITEKPTEPQKKPIENKSKPTSGVRILTPLDETETEKV